MRVLLVRPPSPNERFGLGPFFRIEPLGLEYIATALRRHGHQVRIADLRFRPALRTLLQSFRPSLVGVTATHEIDTRAALQVIARIKQHDRSIFTLLGGHAASVHPEPFMTDGVDAICVGDGEVAVPLLADALSSQSSGEDVPGLRLARGGFALTAVPERACLDDVALPARELVAHYQSQYLCVHKTPLWAVETTRGCPYRCRFCSIWRLHERSFRMRSVAAVCDDMQQAGDNIFVVDDLFFHPVSRSLELARELTRRGVRKGWILVQARLDTVAKNVELLEAWRPLAHDFDIFFGFEAPGDEQLARLDKDMKGGVAAEAVEIARRHRFGVTGNFVVDPDWDQAAFEAMWRMVDELALTRSGYTVLTPLHGTQLYDDLEHRLVERDPERYDMHHILYEPKLGRQRFFELFVQSWRRNVLSPRYSATNWWRWLRGLNPKQAFMLGRVLLRTQRMLRVEPYLKETFPLQIPAMGGVAADCAEGRR